MKLLGYLKALVRVSLPWLERGDLSMNVVQAIVVLLGSVVGAVGLPDVTNWGVPASTATGALGAYFVVVVFIAPYRLWKQDRKAIDDFEAERVPKIAISEPIELREPKGTPPSRRSAKTYRLRIKNNSTSRIIGCKAVKTSFVNRFGEQDDSLMVHFRVSTENALLSSHDFQQQFDIDANSEIFIDVAFCQEADVDSVNVIMLYAKRKTAEYRDQIPSRFFPHILQISFSAENIIISIVKNYRLYITREGFFRMEEV